MIDQVEQLTATSADAEKVIDQLPLADAGRNSLLDSLNATKPNTSSGLQRLRTGAVYTAIIVAATALAVLLISMMGRR